MKLGPLLQVIYNIDLNVFTLLIEMLQQPLASIVNVCIVRKIIPIIYIYILF